MGFRRHVQSLTWEDSLEEQMATHSNILAWKIPWTEEPGELQSGVGRGFKEFSMTECAHKPFANVFLGNGEVQGGKEFKQRMQTEGPNGPPVGHQNIPQEITIQVDPAVWDSPCQERQNFSP